MYTLISAVKRKTKYSGDWIFFNIANEKLNNIVNRLGWVVIELKPSFGNKTKWVNLVNLEDKFIGINLDMTFSDWLRYIGDINLPFNSIDFYKQYYVKYVQAWHSDYNFQPVHPYINAQVDISPYEKSDLIVTHPTIDHTYLGEYGIFSVNGLMHISYYGLDELRIVDGFKSILKYNDNQIGLWSFENIGKIQCIPIKEEYLSKYDTHTKYLDKTYLTLPENIDYNNKSIFFVIGGYPYFIGDNITPVNENSFSLTVKEIFTIEKYFQLQDRLDISDWGLNTDENNPSRFKVSDLFSDDTIIKLLTMSQSFIVVVDSPTLKETIVPVEYIKLPGRYLDDSAHKLPLCGVNGICVDYHTIKEDIVTVLAASNNRRKNYFANTLDWTKENYLDSGLTPYRPFVDETTYYRLISN